MLCGTLWPDGALDAQSPLSQPFPASNPQSALSQGTECGLGIRLTSGHRAGQELEPHLHRINDSTAARAVGRAGRRVSERLPGSWLGPSQDPLPVDTGVLLCSGGGLGHLQGHSHSCHGLSVPARRCSLQTLKQCECRWSAGSPDFYLGSDLKMMVSAAPSSGTASLSGPKAWRTRGQVACPEDGCALVFTELHTHTQAGSSRQALGSSTSQDSLVQAWKEPWLWDPWFPSLNGLSRKQREWKRAIHSPVGCRHIHGPSHALGTPSCPSHLEARALCTVCLARLP